MEKGRNAVFQHFLNFPTMFLNDILCMNVERCDEWFRVKMTYRGKSMNRRDNLIFDLHNKTLAMAHHDQTVQSM